VGGGSQVCTQDAVTGFPWVAPNMRSCRIAGPLRVAVFGPFARLYAVNRRGGFCVAGALSGKMGCARRERLGGS